MYCYLLEFSVREGEEDRFIESWGEVTEYIRRQFGSLGSRLHKTADGAYIAYAQWPDKESRFSDHAWSAEGLEARERMLDTLDGRAARVIYEFQVVKDLLK